MWNFFYSLIYYLLHFPPVLLHLSPKKRINPAELNPLNRSIHHKEVSISIRTAISASHLQCTVPFHSNSGSMQRTRAKRAEKPKNCCPVTWSGREPRDQERGHRIWKPSGIRYIGESFPRSSSWNDHHSSGGEKEKAHVCSPGPAKASRVTQKPLLVLLLCFSRECIFIGQSLLIKTQ